jgi:chemotaxis signal transduction protein
MRTPRSLAIALNGGRARPKALEADPTAFEELLPLAAVTPFRERVASRVGRADLLVFRVGNELFATELRAVEEAVEGATARPVPDAPPSMLGLFALRDRMLPMYLLSRVLGLAHGGGEMTLVLRPSTTRVALAVDAVEDVYDTALDAVRAVPSAGEADNMVLGVVWRGAELITLLDADLVVAACLVATPPDSL